jgi:hypothetical protein
MRAYPSVDARYEQLAGTPYVAPLLRAQVGGHRTIPCLVLRAGEVAR